MIGVPFLASIGRGRLVVKVRGYGLLASGIRQRLMVVKIRLVGVRAILLEALVDHLMTVLEKNHQQSCWILVPFGGILEQLYCNSECLNLLDQCVLLLRIDSYWKVGWLPLQQFASLVRYAEMIEVAKPMCYCTFLSSPSFS